MQARNNPRAAHNPGRYRPQDYRYYGRYSRRLWSLRFQRWQYWSPSYQRWYFYSDTDNAWVAVSLTDVDEAGADATAVEDEGEAPDDPAPTLTEVSPADEDS
jgi:hypothetical protein